MVPAGQSPPPEGAQPAAACARSGASAPPCRAAWGSDRKCEAPTPTPTPHPQMMREAEEFAVHARTFELAFREYSGDVQGESAEAPGEGGRGGQPGGGGVCCGGGRPAQLARSQPTAALAFLGQNTRARAQKATHTHTHTHTDYLYGLAPIMDAPLPRVWRHVPGTELCEPLRPDISHGHPG